jgi:hypothetical protein
MNVVLCKSFEPLTQFFTRICEKRDTFATSTAMPYALRRKRPVKSQGPHVCQRPANMGFQVEVRFLSRIKLGVKGMAHSPDASASV